MGERAERRGRRGDGGHFWFTVSLAVLVAFLAGGALTFALFKLAPGVVSGDKPKPPPPQESVPLAPGPDNTITKAPPRPPAEMPAREKGEDEKSSADKDEGDES